MSQVSGKTSRKGKKAIVIVINSLLGIVIIGGAIIGGLFIYSSNYHVPKGSDSTKNNTGLIMQGTMADDRRSLYDKDGKRIILRGINAGNILLQEGWMSPFATKPKYNKDGTLVKDKDLNIQYPEFTQEDFLKAIDGNPNLSSKKDELLDHYYRSFFSEEDFRIIKEDLRFNTIRLPFYWRNILNDDLTRKPEEDAFSYLDWFLENCKKYGLYLVLDLHGAPGSQNGYEHSGLILDKASLWTNQDYQKATIDLWDYVSEHYTSTRPDLGTSIASYDLLNEPQEKKDTPESTVCFDFQDEIYKAIRANNDRHLITIESMWDFSVSPNPEKYDWENIMYEYHHYNWNRKLVSMDSFKAYHDAKHIGTDYDVPIYIGEFTYFENRDDWKAALVDWYDQRNYSWTIWSYKATVTGGWTTSWGVYTVQLNLDTETEQKKTDVSTCTEDEFRRTCDMTKTENCAKGTLYEVISDYNNNYQETLS